VQDTKIHFEPNIEKALEAILYVLSKRPQVNLYNVLKVVFEADKRHLNQHGRPVTGDAYIKMKHGTVPSAIFDMVRFDSRFLPRLQIREYPYQKIGQYDLKAERKPNLDVFSQSDLEALDEGIAAYLDLSFTEVQEKNHSEKCWIEGKLNAPIPFEAMIENPKILEELQHTGLRIVL
jgi:hypothetical protein